MDIAKELRDHASSDHTRGCEGRCYSCTCGYDSGTETVLETGAAEIARLTRELADARDAKRRALAIADERSKENVALRAQLSELTGMMTGPGSADWIGENRRLRQENERLRAALEQAVDDFAEGHCVCEETRQMCIAAVAGEQTEPTKP